MTIREDKKKNIYKWEGRIFTLYRDSVTLPDGREALRDYVVHSGGAAILPVDGDLNCHLVRQWRYPQDEAVLEMPAGKLEPGETPERTALRELSEEVGFTAGRIQSLGITYPTPAYVRECMYLYLATELTPVPRHPDDGEFLELVTLPLSKAVDMVYENGIRDAKTQIAILKAARILGI